MIHNLAELIPALQAAKKWQLLPEPQTRSERFGWLQRLADHWGELSDQDLNKLATESGLSESLVQAWDIEGGKAFLQSFLLEASQRQMQDGFLPRGVLSLLQPRVHGLRMLLERLAPALLAGNSVLIKMSSQTPWASQMIENWLRQAGIPKDVAQVVLGSSQDYSSFLIAHPAVQGVSLVGRLETVERVQKESTSLKRAFQAWSGGRSNLLQLSTLAVSEWSALLQSSFVQSKGRRPYDFLRIFVLEKEESVQLSALQTLFEQWPWLETSLAEAESFRAILESMQAEEGRLVTGGDIEISGEVARIRPALIAHLAQCSEQQQVQHPFPILLFSGVKYPFDTAKWVNNASQGFALRMNGEVERIQKLTSKFEVGAVLENGDFRPAQSLLFGVKESAVGNTDLKTEGSFFSQKRKVFSSDIPQ